MLLALFLDCIVKFLHNSKYSHIIFQFLYYCCPYNKMCRTSVHGFFGGQVNETLDVGTLGVPLRCERSCLMVRLWLPTVASKFWSAIEIKHGVCTLFELTWFFQVTGCGCMFLSLLKMHLSDKCICTYSFHHLSSGEGVVSPHLISVRCPNYYWSLQIQCIRDWFYAREVQESGCY